MAVNIKLDPYHKITSDKYCYTLHVRSKRKNKQGKYTWTGVKFTSTLNGILKCYKELKIRSSDCETIQEILELSKEIDRKIDKILGEV